MSKESFFDNRKSGTILVFDMPYIHGIFSNFTSASVNACDDCVVRCVINYYTFTAGNPLFVTYNSV